MRHCRGVFRITRCFLASATQQGSFPCHSLQTMQIHVQNFAGSVPVSASVAELKSCIQERLDVVARRLRLIRPSENGTSAVLDDTEQLAACGVADGTTLHLFIEDRVPFELEFEHAAGCQGCNALQFNRPNGVCLSPSGDVLLVSDFTNHRVQALRADNLTHLHSFGSKGSGPGQLNYPWGVCASGDFVHIADFANKRAKTFRLDGTLICCSAELPGTPTGICASASGHWLCVAEATTHRVHVLHTADLVLARSIGSEGSGASQLHYPRGVCFSPSDELLFVADGYNHRVQAFRFFDGVHVRSIGSKGSGELQFDCPFDVRAVGSHLLVADINNHRVQVLTSEGVHVRTIGVMGTDAGQFTSPSALCVSADGARLFVVEQYGHRVQLFSARA